VHSSSRSRLGDGFACLCNGIVAALLIATFPRVSCTRIGLVSLSLCVKPTRFDRESRRPRPRARRGGRGATLCGFCTCRRACWLLCLSRWRVIWSQRAVSSSVSFQSPLALSRCVCDLSQTCEISLCAEPNHF